MNSDRLEEGQKKPAAKTETADQLMTTIWLSVWTEAIVSKYTD